MNETGPELHRLANGVRLALDPMPGLASAAVGVWIRVGARWEKASENGVAHLFEHMAFKGAGGRDAKRFAEAIEAVGGSINAATGYERTAYYARCLAEDAPFALDLVADIVLAPHWEPAELAKEKGVVLQEIGEAADQPDDRIFEAHQSALFPDQPLGRPILGAAETLENISVETLHRFRADHAAGPRIVIAVAGGFDAARIRESVEARFAAEPTGAATIAEAAAPKPGVALEARKLEQTHLVFSWAAPAAAAPEAFPARVLSEILGGGMSSRLFQDVREARGLVYAIDSWVDSFEDVGRLGVYAGCGANEAEEVSALVAAALIDLAENGPTSEELARAKATLRASLMMGAEAPLARAEARATQAFLRDRLIPFTELRALVDAVDAEAVRRAALAAIAGPVAAAAIGPKRGLDAARRFAARFA